MTKVDNKKITSTDNMLLSMSFITNNLNMCSYGVKLHKLAL